MNNAKTPRGQIVFHQMALKILEIYQIFLRIFAWPGEKSSRRWAFRPFSNKTCSNTLSSVIDTAFYAENLRPDPLNLKWAHDKFLTYDINNMDSGSAIPSTDRYTICAIRVDVPPVEGKLRIVEMLNPIEDKIELNQKITDRHLSTHKVRGSHGFEIFAFFRFHS